MIDNIASKNVIRRTIYWFVSVVFVLIVLGYALLSYFIALGVSKAEREDQEDHPSNYGLHFEEVSFFSRGDNIELDGWYIVGDDSSVNLIFVHGISSNRTGDNAMDLASRLVDKGFSVLLFDLRAHGSSGGERISGGDHERRDVLGAYDFLVNRGVPSNKIGVLGFSMGAATSILALAEESSIQALVADSPYANVSDLMAYEISRKTIIPESIAPIFIPGATLCAGLFFDIDISVLDTETVVSKLDYPILVIHGSDDTRIPVEHGIRVHMASHPESDLWLLPEVDHVDSFTNHPSKYVQKVVKYFTNRLMTD